MGSYSAEWTGTNPLPAKGDPGKISKTYEKWCYKIRYTLGAGETFSTPAPGRRFALDFSFVRGNTIIDPANAADWKAVTDDSEGLPAYKVETVGGKTFVETTPPPAATPEPPPPAAPTSWTIEVCFVIKKSRTVKAGISLHTAADDTFKWPAEEIFKGDKSHEDKAPGAAFAMAEPARPTEVLGLIAYYEGQKLASLLALSSISRPVLPESFADTESDFTSLSAEDVDSVGAIGRRVLAEEVSLGEGDTGT